MIKEIKIYEMKIKKYLPRIKLNKMLSLLKENSILTSLKEWKHLLATQLH